MASRQSSTTVLLWQIAIGLGALAIWQWGWDLRAFAALALVPDLLDPYFVSKPSEIWKQFLRMGCLVGSTASGRSTAGRLRGAALASRSNNLWIATYFTLKNTLWGFSTGVSSGFALGLLLGRSDRL